jgi:hypothetical protein
LSESIALHVIVTVCPSGNTSPLVRPADPGPDEQVTGSVPSARSLAVGAGQVTVAPFGPVACCVMLPGVLTITGEVVTVIVNVTGVAATFELFFALHVTVVVLIAKVPPDAGTQVTVSVPSSKSVATGVW